MGGHAEDFRHEAGNGAREQLEGRSARQCTVRGSSTNNDQGDDTQNSFNGHGTVTHKTHVLFIGDHLRRRARRHQAVEAGNSTASNRHKEHREEVKALDFKTNESRKIDVRILNKDTDHTTQDHADEKEHAQVVTGLLQKPHRNNSGCEKVGKNDVTPRFAVSIDREFNTQPDHHDHQNDTNAQLFATAGLTILQVKTEHDGANHVDHGDGGGSSVRNNLFARCREAIKGIGHDVAESSDHKDREEPAKEQEQLTTGTTDVFFDDGTHGLAAALHRSVKGREVLNATKEDGADQHPKQGRKPTEHSGDNRTRDGAGTGDGGKLVSKHTPAIGRRVVLTVVEYLGRGFCIGVDTPRLFKPSRINAVA